jgi:hypothetical protein
MSTTELYGIDRSRKADQRFLLVRDAARRLRG